ncbi:MAG: bactofilin family protein [Patescibacteria group bacterium]|jgi:cytoskeletal protein CcmA (bactofilin family)
MFEGNGQDTMSGPGTVVGANVKLTGTISDVNDITVHGTVDGEVRSDKTVTISETASVKGPVTAQMVSVSGRVNGSIVAQQKLELQPTAVVSGSITTAELNIKPGAVFNGKSTMAKGDEQLLRDSKAHGNETAHSNPTPIRTEPDPVPEPEPKQPESKARETVPATQGVELED